MFMHAFMQKDNKNLQYPPFGSQRKSTAASFFRFF